METEGLIYGRNPVLEYLKSDSRGIEALFLAEKAHGKIIDIIMQAAKAGGVPIERQDRRFFSRLGPSSVHQGVAIALKGGPAPSKRKGLSLLDEFSPDSRGQADRSKTVLVLLDHITDPQNMGSIIRSAEALGAAGIIVPKDNSCEVNPTVVKSSAGATAHIPIETITNVAAYLKEAKKKGFWIIGTGGEGTAAFEKIRDLDPVMAVIGSEGSGMRRLTEEHCDFVVGIPLKGKVSSLNASAAAAIVLYELLR